jgi:hypothetical protein
MSRCRSSQPVLFCAVVAAVSVGAGAGATVSAAPLVQEVGQINVGQPLGRIVADPVRPRVYGIAANGDVVFMDRTTMAVQKTIQTNRKLTDIDVAPDGSFMTVLDNVTREYWNQPPATYLLKYDLNTQAQSGQTFAQSPLFHMALGRPDRVAGVAVNQWVNVYQVNTATGAQLSTAGGGYFGSGSTDWSTVTLVSNPQGTRMYRTEIGISSIELLAFDISTDTITSAGARTVGSYTTEPVFINSTGSSLYVGDLRINPMNVSQVTGLFPENIYAATGDDQLAFGASGIYDPAWGTYLGAMPYSSTRMTIGEADRYLYALDATGSTVHVMRVVPEPARLPLLLGALTLLARRARRDSGSPAGC